jgi:hypothetical protein
VDTLVNISEYNLRPQYAPAFGVVIGISYDQMMVDIHPGADALCRLHYDYVTDTIICIDSIVDIVNQNYEAAIPLIGGNWVMVPSVFAVGDEGSTISAHLYPNPVQDLLHINLGLSETDDVQLEIMDELGRKVLEQTYPDVYVKTVDVDLGSLSNGVYMVSLRTGHGKITRRVVLNR